jgi:hypothetical protein
MKIHIHDNNAVPVDQNCLGSFEADENKIITLHFHAGNCHLCPDGHCHNGSIAITTVGEELFLSFESIMTPIKITYDDQPPRLRKLISEDSKEGN